MRRGVKAPTSTISRSGATARAGAAPVIPAAGAVHQEMQAGGLVYTRGPYYPSLAYRLVQVATGKLDAVATRRGSQDWDIAAAAVILAESGRILPTSAPATPNSTDEMCVMGRLRRSAT